MIVLLLALSVAHGQPLPSKYSRLMDRIDYLQKSVERLTNMVVEDQRTRDHDTAQLEQFNACHEACVAKYKASFTAVDSDVESVPQEIFEESNKCHKSCERFATVLSKAIGC